MSPQRPAWGLCRFKGHVPGTQLMRQQELAAEPTPGCLQDQGCPHGPMHLSCSLSLWCTCSRHYLRTPPFMNAETGQRAGGTLPGALSCAVEEPKPDLGSPIPGPFLPQLGDSHKPLPPPPGPHHPPTVLSKSSAHCPPVPSPPWLGPGFLLSPHLTLVYCVLSVS